MPHVAAMAARRVGRVSASGGVGGAATKPGGCPRRSVSRQAERSAASSCQRAVSRRALCVYDGWCVGRLSVTDALPRAVLLDACLGAPPGRYDAGACVAGRAHFPNYGKLSHPSSMRTDRPRIHLYVRVTLVPAYGPPRARPHAGPLKFFDKGAPSDRPRTLATRGGPGRGFRLAGHWTKSPRWKSLDCVNCEALTVKVDK